jgi:hypothetical protein
MANVGSLRMRLEVDHMLNPKISMISLNASKSFLDRCLLDDNGDGIVEFFYSEQL